MKIFSLFFLLIICGCSGPPDWDAIERRVRPGYRNFVKLLRGKRWCGTVLFAGGESIRVRPDGTLLAAVHTDAGTPLTLTLDNRKHACSSGSYSDLSLLFRGAVAGGLDLAGMLQKHVSLTGLLKTAVFHYYRQFSGTNGSGSPAGGNPLASNRFGSFRFRYGRLQQADTISPADAPDYAVLSAGGKRTVMGMECLAISFFQMCKALGLVPGELTVFSLAKRFTDIYGPGSDSRRIRGNVPALRGFASFSLDLALSWANALRQTDWAKLTGCSEKRLVVQAGLVQTDRMLQKGYTGRCTKGMLITGYHKHQGHSVNPVAIIKRQPLLICYDDPWHAPTDGVRYMRQGHREKDRQFIFSDFHVFVPENESP